MRVIEGKDVDLIVPFPVSQAHRAFGWLKAYHTTTLADGGPQTPEEFRPYIEEMLQRTASYGIIDKNNILRLKAEAPLIGFILFEVHPFGAYGHIAGTNRKGKAFLIEEGSLLAIRDVFEGLPDLLRIGAAIVPQNRGARGLAEKLGFLREGRVRHAIRNGGIPQDMLMYGLTREDWEKSNGSGNSGS